MKKRGKMDENTIKVLARFTGVGQDWPIGAWYYVGFDIKVLKGETGWCQAKENDRDTVRRQRYMLCELETNQKGVFRTDDRDRYAGR